METPATRAASEAPSESGSMDWAVSSQAGEEEVALANGNADTSTPSLDEKMPSVEVSRTKFTRLVHGLPADCAAHMHLTQHESRLRHPDLPGQIKTLPGTRIELTSDVCKESLALLCRRRKLRSSRGRTSTLPSRH